MGQYTHMGQNNIIISTLGPSKNCDLSDDCTERKFNAIYASVNDDSYQETTTNDEVFRPDVISLESTTNAIRKRFIMQN